VKILIAHDTQFNVKNELGYTAFSRAEDVGYRKIIAPFNKAGWH